MNLTSFFWFGENNLVDAINVKIAVCHLNLSFYFQSKFSNYVQHSVRVWHNGSGGQLHQQSIRSIVSSVGVHLKLTFGETSFKLAPWSLKTSFEKLSSIKILFILNPMGERRTVHQRCTALLCAPMCCWEKN